MTRPNLMTDKLQLNEIEAHPTLTSVTLQIITLTVVRNVQKRGKSISAFDHLNEY